MPIRSLYIRFLQQLVGVLLPTIEQKRFLQLTLAKLEILFADFYFQSIIQLFNDSLPFTTPFC